jgi:MFS transporter, FSR family, fosmidomycin resistance protein
MKLSVQMTQEEWLFGFIIASVHAAQHLFLRLLPPLIPIFIVDLDSPLWQLGLLVSIYLFAGGLFQAPVGILSDRMDRKHLLVPAFVLMSTGYIIFVSAPTIGNLLPVIQIFSHEFNGPFQLMSLGMFIAGVGYSVVHPVGYPLISANISSDNRGKVLGMWGSASKIGDAAAPFLVGVFILVFSWQWILVGVSLFGILYAGILWAIFQTGRFETQPPEKNRSNDGGSKSNKDWRSQPRQFLYPVTIVILFFFFVLFVGNGIQIFTPIFVSEVYAYSFSILGIVLEPESVANFYFSVMLISGAVSTLITGALADRFDHRSTLVALLGISAIGLFVLTFITLTPITLLVFFIIVGSCLFGVNPVRDALITDITPPEYEGRTFGYIWTVALIASSAYPTIIGYLGDTIGVQQSFGFLATGALGAIFCILLLYSSQIYIQTPAIEEKANS